MNKIIGVCLLFFGFSAYAQLEKGSFLIGGSGSLNGGFGVNGGQYKLDLQPSGAVFVAKKFAIGTGLGFSSQYLNFGGSYFSNQGLYLSPFARYYFLPSDSRFNLFAQAGVSVGGFWSKDEQSSNYRLAFVPTLKTGLVYFIRPQVAFEAAIIAGFDPNTPVFIPSNQISGSLGFQIHLNKRQKQSEIQL